MKLEVKNLHKSFSGNEVLHGISFSVESERHLDFLEEMEQEKQQQ